MEKKWQIIILILFLLVCVVGVLSGTVTFLAHNDEPGHPVHIVEIATGSRTMDSILSLLQIGYSIYYFVFIAINIVKLIINIIGKKKDKSYNSDILHKLVLNTIIFIIINVIHIGNCF